MRAEYDTLGRRNDRFKRLPKNKRHVCSEADHVMFCKIQDHGPLSTPILDAFLEPYIKAEKTRHERYKTFFNEHNNPQGEAYLDRPDAQKNIDLRSNCIWYTLTNASKDVLKRQGLLSAYGAPRTNSWQHDTLCSTISSSFEIAQTDAIQYRGRTEVLDAVGKPLRFKVPYKFDGEPHEDVLVPDGVFELDYVKSGNKLLVFFEGDRSTERLDTPDHTSNSIKKKLLMYREFIGRGLYKEALDTKKGAVVIFCFTSYRRQKHAMQCLERQAPQNNYILFTSIPMFGTDLQEEIIVRSLMTRGYERVGAEPFYIDRI